MIRIGVIGYGYWGPNLARCVSECDTSILAAVADSSTTALARAGNRYPAAQLYENFDELIADPTIDAVSIATPVATHFELARAALLAGKHVLVEKPMTSSSESARSLVDLAADRKLVLMVGHTFVYTGAVQKIDELIQNKTIGEVFYYDSTRINLGLFQSDVNVIWDLAVHDVAVLDFLMQDSPVAVSASATGHIRGNQENMAHLTLFYDGGMVAHLNVNWLAPVKVRQTLIGGSRRMIVYDDLQPSEKVKIYDRGVTLHAHDDEEVNKLRVSYRMGDMWAPQLSTKEALLTEIEHFVSCVEQGAQPRTSGLSGLRVVQALESAMLSLRGRGNPIELRKLQRAS